MNDHTPGTCIRHRWWRPVGRMQYAPTRVPAPTNQRGAAPNKPTSNGPPGPNDRNDARTAAHSSLAGCLVGRMQYAPTRVRRRPRPTSPASVDAPRPRKVSNKLFQGFRRVGKAQTSCFKVSEASERLKQVVSRFPTRRKGSNKLFQGIRGLGKAQTSCFKVSDASGRLRTPAKLAGYIKSPYPASFPASAEAVRRHLPRGFSRTESRTITLNPRFYGRLH